MKQYRHLYFPNNNKGQIEKIKTLEEESKKGWRVTSETISPGHFQGDKACCFFLIFAPCAFFAGSTNGQINVTIEREVAEEERIKIEKEKEERIYTETKDEHAKPWWGVAIEKKTLLLPWILIFFVILIIGLISHYSQVKNNTPQNIEPTSDFNSIDIGKQGVLRIAGKNDDVLVGSSQQVTEVLVKASVAGDIDRMTQLVLNGDAYYIPAGTSVLVINESQTLTEVKILKGKMVGHSGWVPREFVSAK
ncbi:MAG: hypothetical protein WC697_01230 [Patescibacteria group bacterium]|jgi:hypothetical protein